MAVWFFMLLMIFFGCHILGSSESEIGEALGGVLITIFGIVFIISLVILPINRMGILAEIEQFKSVEETIEVARTADIDSYEKAAIQNKIIDSNKWLAKVKYYNGIYFINNFIPNEVDELTPIK